MKRGGLILTTPLSATLLSLALSGCVPPASPTAQVTPTATVSPPASETQKPAPEPEKPPAVEDIAWERLDIGMEPDSVYQPWMLKTSIQVLEGKPVRIKG